MTQAWPILADLVKYLATVIAAYLAWKDLLAYWKERLPIFGCEVIPGLRGITPKEERQVQEQETNDGGR